MLDQFLALLERFVVAHELIAANSGKAKDEFDEAREIVKKNDEAKNGSAPAKTTRTRKAPVKEEEPEDDEPEEKAPPKKRASKSEAPAKTGRGKSKGPDLRAEIGEMAKKAVEGDDLEDDDADDLVDKFDDLLEEFEVKNVKELDDDQVADFHKELKAIIEEYYDAE